MKKTKLKVIFMTISQVLHYVWMVLKKLQPLAFATIQLRKNNVSSLWGISNSLLLMLKYLCVFWVKRTNKDKHTGTYTCDKMPAWHVYES